MVPSDATVTTVPVLSGSVIVRSAVGSVAVIVVSLASAVEPSKIRLALFSCRLPVSPPPVSGRKPEPAVTPCSHAEPVYTFKAFEVVL